MIMIQVYTSDSAPEEARRLLVEYAPRLNEPMYQLVQAGQAAGQVVPGDPVKLIGTLMACVTGVAVNEMLGPMAAASFPDPEMVLRILKA